MNESDAAAIKAMMNLNESITNIAQVMALAPVRHK